MKPPTANKHKQAEEDCLRIMRTLAEKYEKGKLSKIELKLEKKVMIQGLVAAPTSASKKRPAAAPTSASKKRPAAAPTSASKRPAAAPTSASQGPAAAPTSEDDYYCDYYSYYYYDDDDYYYCHRDYHYDEYVLRILLLPLLLQIAATYQ
jgi:hypothetical protein